MTTLTATESQELAQCEAVIRAGIQSFVDVGNALLRISDGRLYRQTHSTFKEYIEQTYKMSVRKAYQLCEQVEVINELKEADPVCANVAQSHAAELAKAPKGQRAEVLKKAQALAGDSKLTAAHIAETISPKSFCTACQTAYIKADGHECKDAAQAEEEREMIRVGALQQQAKDAFKGLVIPPEASPRNAAIADLERAVADGLASLDSMPDLRALRLTAQVGLAKIDEKIKAVRMEGAA